jgi:hypothetical protein
MKCIQIFKDGKMDELNISSKNVLKKLKANSKSQGNDELNKLYSWNFEGDDIHCYGWYDGEKGFENLHDLPHGGKSDFIDEDSSEKIIYGDLFILKYRGDALVDINVSDYSVFYSDTFENFNDYISGIDEDIDYADNEEANENINETTEDINEATESTEANKDIEANEDIDEANEDIDEANEDIDEATQDIDEGGEAVTIETTEDLEYDNYEY